MDSSKSIKTFSDNTVSLLDSLLQADDRPTYICNKDKQLVYYNAAFEKTYLNNIEQLSCYSLIFEREGVCPWCPIDSELTITNFNAKSITIYNNCNDSWLEIKCSEVILENEKYYLLKVKEITAVCNLEEDCKLQYELYKKIFRETFYACAYHKIIQDKEGKVIDFEFLEVNKKFEEFIGLKASQVVGKKVTELFSDVDNSNSNWVDYYEKVAMTGESGQIQEYCEKLDKWFKISVFSSQKGYFFSLFEDITDTIKLIEEMQLLSVTAERANIATIWSDENSKIIKINDETVKLLGYSKQELLKMNITEIDVNLTKKNSFEHLQHLRENHNIDLLTVLKRKNNTTFDAHISAQHFKIKGQDYVVGHIYDLTEYKKVEKELKEKGQELEKKLEEAASIFQHVMDNTPAAINIINLEGNILLINKFAAQLVNSTPEKLKGANINEYVTPESLEELQRSIDTVRQAKKPVVVEETMKLFLSEEEHPFISAKFPLFDDNGDLYAIGMISTDIKEIKTTQEVLKRTQKELLDTNLNLVEAHKHKDKFLSSMSHELRTPLNAIIGFTDMLNSAFTEDFNETQKEYLKIIKDSSVHLLSLINDVLDISRISAGKMELSLREINLIDFINDLVSSLLPQIEEKKLMFENDIDLELVSIHADYRKLKQIFLNLLSNAFKYTPEGGRVILRACKNNNNLLVNVIDTGYGIGKEEHDKIFTEFFKSSVAEKYAVGGTGIGLVLTRKLVQMHKGKIGFESEEDKGSNFWFTIPLNLKDLTELERHN